jgi:hypothetical protein
MTNARYFDEDVSDAGLVDSAVQDMARRQLGFSLVVAFALLAGAGLLAVRGGPAGFIEASAPHKIIRIEAPRVEVAQPVFMVAPRG